MEEHFIKKYHTVIEQIGDHASMVLATSNHDIVSARTMSVVVMDQSFYFQTDCNFRKHQDLLSNPHAALCFDNIQIEGLCKDLGHPRRHNEFCSTFQTYFRLSYDAYTTLENKRLWRLDPTKLQRWLYINEVPWIEQFDITLQQYKLMEYKL